MNPTAPIPREPRTTAGARFIPAKRVLAQLWTAQFCTALFWTVLPWTAPREIIPLRNTPSCTALPFAALSWTALLWTVSLWLALIWPALFSTAILLHPTAAAGQPTTGQSKAGPIVLLAAGDLRGEIKPCGCSPQGQMGGLPRRLSYIEQASKQEAENILLVDLGNNFPPPSPQGQLKVDLIQEMLARFPPAAILPGPHELALGASRLAHSLPYLVSNDAVGHYFKAQHTVTRAGTRIGVFGFLSPGEIYQKSQQRFRLVPVNAEFLNELRAQIKSLGHRRAVLLFRGSDAELEMFVRSRIFDVIVAGNPHADELNQVVDRRVADTVVPQVPTKGQGVLRIELKRGALRSGDPAQVDWLTDKFADHPDARAPYQYYDDQVKKLFFAKLETMQKRKAASPYVGAAACRECHTAPYAIWGASRHAGAITTLEKVGKQFDPECLACHVVGLERGGYLSKDLTPQLAGVQCENCHGPGRAHLLNPKANRTGLNPQRSAGHAAKVGEATCRGCHVGSHSPAFDFQKYWPRIQHKSTATHSGAARNSAGG